MGTLPKSRAAAGRQPIICCPIAHGRGQHLAKDPLTIDQDQSLATGAEAEVQETSSPRPSRLRCPERQVALHPSTEVSYGVGKPPLAMTRAEGVACTRGKPTQSNHSFAAALTGYNSCRERCFRRARSQSTTCSPGVG